MKKIIITSTLAFLLLLSCNSNDNEAETPVDMPTDSSPTVFKILSLGDSLLLVKAFVRPVAFQNS